MVKFDDFSQNADDKSAALSIILLSVSMLSLVIAVMGIKLRWFRHRLTLDQAESQSESPVLLRTTSVTEFRENCARGVYRQSSGDDSIIIPDNSSNVPLNGKTKTKTSDRHSIFRMPFKSKLSLSRHSSREENQVTTIQQAVSASTFPPNRAQDYATVQKNENLKRLIHERLQSRYSNSMPTLNNEQDLNPKQYRERSVDEVLHSSIQQERKQDYVNEAKHENHANQALPKIEFPLESSDKNQVSEEIFQKRVKFEEVSEIEETVFEAQFENDIVERSTNSVANIESEKSTTPPPTPYYVQEFDDIDLPPKPMKRKSRENSFNTPSTAFQNSHIEEENETTEPTITENELRLSAPPVKPRTKRLAHRTSDIEKDEVDSFLVIQTLQEEIKISVEQDFFNVDKKLTEKLETIENHENDVVFEVEPREVQAGPKSILKSSETSSTQKTITFHNTPLSIPYNETSSSSSSSYASYESDEEEDVWSRVNIHRYHLNRHNDVPPPLPKTPPPSEQDEKQISFA